MNKILIRLVINFIALYAAIYLLEGRGIDMQNESWLSIVWLALIFALVNSIIKPLLMVVGCPFVLLTLGLGVLLINTLMFYLAGLIGTWFGVGFVVDGFLPAFLGALIISVVSVVLSGLIRDDRRG